MKTKEQQAKEYAAGIPHYQDRKQHAADDFIAGWDAAEMWRTDKENMPDNGFVLVLYGEDTHAPFGEVCKRSGCREVLETYTRDAMKTLIFDVMLYDRFVCTLRYKYCPLFPIEERELHDFVVSKRPTLRNKPFRIEF